MSTQNETSKKPTHTLRKKFWNGKRTDFETLGVAWERGDGGFYIKLHGTQIIDSGFYAFPIKDDVNNEEGGR